MAVPPPPPRRRSTARPATARPVATGSLGSARRPPIARASAPARWAHRIVRTIEVIVLVAVVAVGATAIVHLTDAGHRADALDAGDVTSTTGAVRVVSVTPSDHATGVSPTAVITVRLSTELARSSPMPSLEPTEPGRWRQVRPGVLQFRPTAPAMPLTEETLTVPGGSHGLRGVDGRHLATTDQVTWQVRNGSVLRLQQLLAELHYLPLDWHRTGSAPSGPDAAIEELYHPPAGTFTWQWSTVPPTLQAAWKVGVDNHMTTGAMVAFERRDDLPAYTSIRAQMWPVLLSAIESGTTNPEGYTYALVSQQRPESLTLWHDGTVVYTSVANTGLATSPTPVGTFFVYLRYASQTMRGVNPATGQYYVDHGVRWVNYFDGSDAIHGFVRASYGFPQSLGCVELPVSHAAVAWTWIHYGTVVTVEPPPTTS